MLHFGKKKQPPAQTQRVEDSWESVPGFPHRRPFATYRPGFYQIYPKLRDEVMQPLLDQHLQRLFEGPVDDGNGDMLDDLIFSAAREALPDLERQRAGHESIIQELTVRQQADRADFLCLAEQAEQEAEVLEREYRDICRRLDAYNNGTQKEEHDDAYA